MRNHLQNSKQIEYTKKKFKNKKLIQSKIKIATYCHTFVNLLFFIALYYKKTEMEANNVTIIGMDQKN